MWTVRSTGVPVLAEDAGDLERLVGMVGEGHVADAVG